MRNLTFPLVAALCTASLQGVPLHAASSVIVPNSLANSEVPFGSGNLVNASYRAQQVYEATQFGAVTGAMLITELRFRPDFAYGGAFTSTIPNIQFNLSTTPRGENGLVSQYSQNVGADDAIVFSGALPLSSRFTGSPKAFDISVPLTTPFLYEPGRGNLLLDIRNTSGSTTTYINGQSVNGDGASRLIGSLNSPTGAPDVSADGLQVVFTPTNTSVRIATLVRGPYLQSATPSNIVVRWRTDEAVDSRISFGTSPDELLWQVVDPNVSIDHALTLTNLSSESTYFYAIESGTNNLAGGPNHYFRTPPVLAKPTRIWAIGDAGTASFGSTAPLVVRDAYSAFAGTNRTDVWLMLGDNAYFSGTDSEYQAAVFDVFQDLLRTTPVWPTIGNHETYAPGPGGGIDYFDIFSLPQDGSAGGVASGTERYYSFDHGAIHFVCLDSELSDRSPGGPMLTWLEQDLAASTKDWTIAFWHSPPYSKGSHDSDFEGNLVQMRESVVPVLESYGVDLVLCGHSHSYERSFLLNGHYGLSGSLTPAMKADSGSGRLDDTGAYVKSPGGGQQGAIYVVAGSAGQTGGGSLNHPAMYVSLNRLGSMVIDVNSNRLDAKFLRETGEVDDYFTVLKQDLPPSILAQPQSKSVYVGGSASFSAQVSGTPALVYQWRHNDEAIEGATNATLNLSNVQLNDAGDYSVVISNAFGSVTSSNATLAVSERPPGPEFDLSRDFSLTANPNLPWSYGYKTALDGSFALNLTRQTSLTDAGVPLDLWGYQPSTLPAVYINASSNTAITVGGQGIYPPGTVFFLAGNDGSEQNFGAIRLTVPAGADGEYQLESAVRTYLNGSFSGDTDYHVVRNGVELFGQFVAPNSSSGFTNAVTLVGGDTLDFLAGRGQDGRQYGSGLVIDARLFRLNSVTSPPSIFVQPQGASVFVGASVNLTVQASGSQPFTFQWLLDGVAIGGTTAPTLNLTNVQLSQAGNYSVVVSNAHGFAVSDTATVAVSTPPPDPTFDLARDFSISSNPGGVWSYGYKTGLSGSFGLNSIHQTSTADNGVPFNFWVLQPSSLPAVYFNASSNTAITVGGQGTFPPRTVFFLAGNEGTPQNFGAIRLTVPPGAEGQYWLESSVRTYLNGPISGDTDYHVVKNGGEVFGQFMPGSSSSGYSNALTLAAGDTIDFLAGRGQDGQLYGSGLIIDARLYRQGSTSSPPSILVQPQGQNILVGTEVTLSIVANGTPPISYQWTKGGTNQLGATNASLVLVSAKKTDAGDYAVVVSNDYGSVTSHVATVTVTPGPSILRVASASAAAGEVVLPIELVANGDENALGFSLSFDTSLLSFAEVSLGNNAIGGSLVVNVNELGAGRVGIGLALAADAAFSEGTQQVVRVAFALASTTESVVTPIEFGDQPVLRQVANAQAVALNASYVNGTVSIDVSGFEADVSPRPDGNNVLSITDWVQVGRFVAGLDAITNQLEFQKADCAPRSIRGNGALSVSDWVQGGRYSAGLDPLTAVGGPTAPVMSAPLAERAQFQAAVARSLSLATTNVLPGGSVSVPISLDAQGNENALAFSVTFDPSKLRFMGAAKLSKVSNATFNANTNQTESGVLGLALAMPAGTSIGAGLDRILLLNFAATATATGSSALTFGEQPVLQEVADVGANPVACAYINGSVVFGFPPPSGPALSARRPGSGLLLFWPSPAQGFELYSTTNLTGDVWTKVQATPIEIGGQIIVTLPTADTQKYFRLMKP